LKENGYTVVAQPTYLKSNDLQYKIGIRGLGSFFELSFWFFIKDTQRKLLEGEKKKETIMLASRV